MSEEVKMMKLRKQRVQYLFGFLYALVLTNIAFILVGSQSLSGWPLVILLNGLAILQLWVQLHYFLHLGKGSGARWNILLFLFASLVVTIVVFGSLWIMKHLNYNMVHTPEMTNQKVMQDENIYR